MLLTPVIKCVATPQNYLPYTSFVIQVRAKHKYHLDYSRYPTLNEADLEEHFTRGSGPGGQAVNKTSNCVLLRHKPTNLFVKCHTHRMAHKNREEARKLLLAKLDEYINGDMSITAQLKAIEMKKSLERKRRHNKLQELKQKWKQLEQLDATENENENAV